MEVNGDYVIVPVEPLYCPFCNHKMILHDFAPYEHRYPDGRPELRHVDVHMKCPACGFWCTFGVPVTKEELERLKRSRYAFKTLRWELDDIYRNVSGYEKESQIVKERLKVLGYW